MYNINDIKELVEKSYGLKVQNIYKVKGGWAALAFVIECGNKKYFLKVYELNRSSSLTYTKYIEEYSKVLIELSNKCGLGSNITIPIASTNGKYKIQTNDYILWLFEYIDAKTIASRKMNNNEKKCLSKIINMMHSSTKLINFDLNFPKEDYSIENVKRIKYFLNNDYNKCNERIISIISKHINELYEYIDYLEKESQKYKTKNIEFVLCHTDIHKWNLMSDKNNVWLIDFEGLKLAPKEQDLRMLDPDYEKYIIDNYYNSDIDSNLIEFYTKLRIIDDIMEEIDIVYYDESDEKTYNEHLINLEDELNKL